MRRRGRVDEASPRARPRPPLPPRPRSRRAAPRPRRGASAGRSRRRRRRAPPRCDRRLASEHDRGHRLREVAVPEGELLECARLSLARAARAVSTTSSPGPSVVRKCVTKKSAAAISRRPLRLAATTTPSRTTRQSGSSAAPSAWAIEPPTVPRFRVTKCPTNGSACRTSGWMRSSFGERRLADGRADPDVAVRGRSRRDRRR